MKTAALSPILALHLILASAPSANAQVPTNFPAISVTTYDSNKVADGYVFLASLPVALSGDSFLMILDNDGTPVDGDKFKELATPAGDLKIQANGQLSYADSFSRLPYTGGWDVNHRIVDSTLTNVIETIQMKNGYLAEFHDLQLLPNGHALTVGYYLSEVDMSQIVEGGHPAAMVSGAIIQELDAQRNAVFQWRSWDHFAFEDHPYATPTAATLSEFHVNDLNMDVDGNLIVGTPTEIRKINRQTGDVMWTLGGVSNEFSVVDGDVSHFGGHGTYRLENGNLLMYNNAVGTNSSQVHEYTLDETNKVATRVWSYIPPTPISGFFTGNAQRLPNGNTFICWGLPRAIGGYPVCSEVTPSGEVVFELSYEDTAISSYRAYRLAFPTESQDISNTQLEVSVGNDYDFGATGVNVNVQALSGGGYNTVTVTRAPYGPIQPSFIGKSPRVLPVRVQVKWTAISSMTAALAFDTTGLGFAHPEQLKVYHRPVAGTGLFVELTPTTYNPGTKELLVSLTQTSTTQLGEFIFGYPDVEDIANPPILARPVSYRVQTNNIVAPRKADSNVVYTVNQTLPVALTWSPKGFARYYELQVDTNPAFSSPVINLQYQTDAFYVWSNALPATTYHWRVRTMIDDLSTGEWSTGAFQTVEPFVGVLAANGGESWQRGLDYFIQWKDNILEDVVIDLYKGGVFVQNVATNSNSGAYEWTVDLGLAPGTDYTFKISSAANGALFDMSDSPFAIDVPEIDNIRVNSDGSVVLNWQGTSANVYVEQSSALPPVSWTEIAGPIAESGWTNLSPQISTNSFYRLRLE